MSFPLKGENILQLAGLGTLPKTLFTAEARMHAKVVQEIFFSVHCSVRQCGAKSFGIGCDDMQYDMVR